MGDITALVDELIAAGVAPGLAASVVARAIVLGKDAAPFRDDLPDTRSKAAKRQQAYRKRQKEAEAASRNVTNSVTNVTQNVTGVTHNERDDNVTKRNESVTEHNENVTPLRPANNDIYLTSSSIDSSEKKESKKERVKRNRNAPLRDDWTPSLRSYQIAEEYGQNVQLVEQIFRDYLKSSGKLYADYDAAFNNFIRNQRQFNRNGNHGTPPTKSGGSLIAALDRELEKLASEERTDPALPESDILCISHGSVR